MLHAKTQKIVIAGVLVMPFFISTAAGALISAVVLYNLQKVRDRLLTNSQ